MLTLALKKIFGTRNDRILKSLRPLVIKINDIERKLEPLSDDELRAKTEEFKARFTEGESLDALEAEAFAVVREASKRVLNMRHFDVQLIGGAILHRGMISEMKTGEGKTLVATLPAYLNALSGKGVHVVTVNDYLARRDADWMGKIYRFLGLSVGVVYSGMSEQAKRAAYLSDITYGQNNEFGFDYLRDNMKFSGRDLMQRGHAFAVVDEVDSILIDEARTPLIISGPADDATDKYQKINRIIPHLKKDVDFEVDLKSKQPALTEAGVAHAERLLAVENLYDPANIELLHHVNQGLRAYTTFERDVDYVVKDGQIIIVDEFTGRLMSGRRWSNGLHQAIEAKEGVQIMRENQTLASITFQNYFRMYSKLSGMTGTADTEAAEFKSIYNLEVCVIPPNRLMVRKDHSDRIFRTRREKYEGAATDIIEVHEKGQPVLVGTISIEQSEGLSRLLKEKGIQHNVLNAKHHEREAEIVAQAGRYRAVTISTNMAGRGTDILLGGNPEFLAAAETKSKEPTDPAFQDALKKYTDACKAEKDLVVQAGGLFIMGTERHESRRIDNQLRGRAGRQGDPGESRFYVSLEDELMLRFQGEKVQNLMNMLGWEEGLAIDNSLMSRTIENAQRRVEGFHFESRKHVTEYDDVMNKQRQVVYRLRHEILDGSEIRTKIVEMIDDLIEQAVFTICDEKTKPMNWDLDKLIERFEFVTNGKYQLPDDITLDHQTLFDTLRQEAHGRYEAKVTDQSEKLDALASLAANEESPIVVHISRDETKPFTFETLEQDTLLETLDYFWNMHLQDMDHLREGIGLRGYGQKNPLYEYQREGFELFQVMLFEMKESVVRKLLFNELPSPRELMAHFEAERQRREALERQMKMIHESPAPETIAPELEQASAAHGLAGPSKDPADERARLLAQKKARRKAAR